MILDKHLQEQGFVPGETHEFVANIHDGSRSKLKKEIADKQLPKPPSGQSRKQDASTISAAPLAVARTLDLTGRKRTSSPGFVYVLTSRAYPGLCKVGSSKKNPLKRLQEFNILDPYRSFAFQDIRFFIRGYHEVERNHPRGPGRQAARRRMVRHQRPERLLRPVSYPPCNNLERKTPYEHSKRCTQPRTRDLPHRDPAVARRSHPRSPRAETPSAGPSSS